MWLLIFFITPIVEMYLLIEVGGYIGALPTIGLVMITAVIGVTLLRIQGLATLTRGVNRLQTGELPAREVVEGLLLAVAGALLLTPGFVTDGIGFILLTPAPQSAGRGADPGEGAGSGCARIGLRSVCVLWSGGEHAAWRGGFRRRAGRRICAAG